jgi:DNA-binding transcriptional LysR family regulator
LPGWTWLEQAIPNAEVVARSSSIMNLISAVKAGLGVTILPCFMADPDPALVRCMGPIQGVRSDLWLLTREDLRDVPRVRAFIDFLAEYVSGMRRLLTGEAALWQREDKARDASGLSRSEPDGLAVSPTP